MMSREPLTPTGTAPAVNAVLLELIVTGSISGGSIGAVA
jgi:hypothetical protein